jgi:4-hydroxy-tetrahydrodipicolinate reductase
MEEQMGDIAIGVVGAAGRMGALLVRLATEADGMTVVAASEPTGGKAVGRDAGTVAGIEPIGVAITDDPEALFAAADVVLEFSVPAATVAHAALAAKHGKRHVIGTTGLNAEQEAALAKAAETTAIVYAPNMSVVVNVFMDVVKRVAGILGPDYDIEIMEMHHKHKIDAPSGTAVGLGKAAAAGRGVVLDEVAQWSREGPTGARRPGDIGFGTLRGGDVVGEHTVMFVGMGERMELTHRCMDRGLFARGGIRAAAWVADKPAGLYGMRDVLGLED